LLASLNTDDPGVSAIDLPYEYGVAAPAASCHRTVRQAQRNALVRFLSADAKAGAAEQSGAEPSQSAFSNSFSAIIRRSGSTLGSAVRLFTNKQSRDLYRD
jgi:adenosine deaminase